jgi:hypothetical protein
MLKMLSVILNLTRRTYTSPVYLAELLDLLENDLSPYFDQIPTSAMDLGYMGTTEAGVYYGNLGSGPYKSLHTAYANLMYEPFTLAELPDGVVSADAEADGRGEPFLGWLRGEETKPEESRKYRVMSEYAKELLDDCVKTQLEVTGWPSYKKDLRKFIRNRSISEAELKQLIAEQKPALGRLLNQVESTAALGFELSPIGLMLARQEIAGRSPEDAAQIDSFFDD